MLLWLVVALGFVVCVAAWHLLRGITSAEAIALFLSSAIVFFIHLQNIYDKATTDNYFISGYVTSMIHRPAYSYKSGKETYEVPEIWIIEQRPNPPYRRINVTRHIHSGEGIEECIGECAISYEAPYHKVDCCYEEQNIYSFSVTQSKFLKTKISDTSTVLGKYFNPIKASDDVVYTAGIKIPYFRIVDYNIANRLIAERAEPIHAEMLEKINSEFSEYNISVGLIITSDNLYFEKLKRSWHQGKANDFVIVVNSEDGKRIRNVNVLTWDNYTLKEKVSSSIMALPSADIRAILSVIGETLRKNQKFVPAEFSKYHFLNVKIPERFYEKIIIFQIKFILYMLLLLYFNPNTKDTQLSWSCVVMMWQKKFNPPQLNWYLHPFTPSGIFLYIVVPALVSSGLF